MKKLSFVLIILLFLLFVGFEVYRKSERAVLKVVEPAIIQVDFNNNKIADNDERICIPDAEAFSAKDLSAKDVISLNYLAMDFAEKTLDQKKIKLKFTDKKSADCRFANVFVNGQNYAELVKKQNFNSRLKEAQKLNLVLLNHNSNKYHTLDCKYGQVARDTAVIRNSQLPQDAIPCKFCHRGKHGKHEDIKRESTYPLMISSNNVKLILTDFTLVLKPHNRCDTTVCREVLGQINSANSSIDMVLFGWDEVPALTNAIKNAMTRGVKVRLVYDEGAGGTEYYNDTAKLAALIPDSVSDRSGSKTETAILMHNKFMVIDNQKVITGSMNFSRTGFSGFNANNLLIINSSQIAQQFTNEFEQMYSGKFHTRKSRGDSSSGTIQAYFSPQDKIIYNQVIPRINVAKSYIYLPAFIITHADMAQALISAKNRGVNVKIIIDATNPTGKGSQISKLRAAGIPVKTENYAGKMHSKTIIIDDKYLIIGSMNFSKSGENKNDENVVILEDSRLARHYRGYFEYLWAKIPERYLKTNPRAESIYSIGSCSDGIDNNFDGKVDKQDVGCQPKPNR